MLHFYDYRPTADLSGNTQKSLQWDLVQHRRAVADVYVFNKLRNNLANLANIAIPPMFVHLRNIIVIITTLNLLNLMFLNPKKFQRCQTLECH